MSTTMLPTKYSYLLADNMPRMIKEAVKEFGVKEGIGKENNPLILEWAAEVGTDVKNIFYADSIPWCGLFVALIAKRAGKQVVNNPLWALSWASFGVHAECPAVGDVLTFVRKTADGTRAGHVALYVGQSKDTYHILGGNQSDSVCIIEILKTRLYAARRPIYQVQPQSVTQVVLNASGVVSTNEA